MICCYQNKKAILIYFLIEGVETTLIYTTSLKFFFISQKNTIRKISNLNILFKQSLRDIILLFHDIRVMDMNLEEWKQLCPKAWETDYDYLQIDRFAKVGEGSYTFRNCKKILIEVALLKRNLSSFHKLI